MPLHPSERLLALAAKHGISLDLDPIAFCRQCVEALRREQAATAVVQKSVTAEFMQAARRVVDYHTKPLPSLTRDEAVSLTGNEFIRLNERPADPSECLDSIFPFGG